MAKATTLAQLERKFFLQRQMVASEDGYIGKDTWRGFRSNPKVQNVPSRRLKDAFYMLTDNFENFLDRNPRLTRSAFDAFHKLQGGELDQFLRKSHDGVSVTPAAKGEFRGYAYNSYAKVVNLAHTHWCFGVQPHNSLVKHPPDASPGLRTLLHVPLDTQVLGGIASLVASGVIPDGGTPSGGMGCVKSREAYMAIQQYLRDQVDTIPSTLFQGHMVSPLAFEALWTR